MQVCVAQDPGKSGGFYLDLLASHSHPWQGFAK